MELNAHPKSDWHALKRSGCVGVWVRVLLHRDGVAVANLKFDQRATIDEHHAPIEIDVMCVAGRGFVSVGDEQRPISAGQTVRWPKNVMHRLWTDDSEMETIMLERLGG